MGDTLSIIIPVLNEAEGIVSFIDHTKQSCSAKIELIVVDGGSVDNTVTLVTPLVDKVIASEAGRAKQMNAGATAASGNILLFLHADSLLSPDADQTIIDSLIASKRTWGRFDVRLSGQRQIFRVIETMMNIRSRISGIATGDQGLFMYRETFNAVGGYQNIALMEDITLSKSLKRMSRPCCLDQQITTSSRRWEQRGIMPTIVLMWRLRLAYALGANPNNLAKSYR
jgi:rSAM/selenodomain-associated transferase 2